MSIRKFGSKSKSKSKLKSSKNKTKKSVRKIDKPLQFEFDELYDEGDSIYITTDFKSLKDIDGKEYKYQLAIEGFEHPEEDRFIVSVYMVKHPDNFSPDLLEEVVSFAGVSLTGIIAPDFTGYGYSANIYSEEFDTIPKGVKDSKEFIQQLTNGKIISILNEPANRAGNTKREFLHGR